MLGCAVLHMGMGPLVLSATTSPYATYAACCNYAFNMESIFDLHHVELNETMGLTQGKIFMERSQMAKVPNGVEILSKISILSRVHERYRRQTTERRTGDSYVR